MSRDLHLQEKVSLRVYERLSGTRWLYQAHTSENVPQEYDGVASLYERLGGTRWQDQAKTSKKLHHRDVVMLQRKMRCVPAPQGCPVPVSD